MWKILQQKAADDFVVGTGEQHSVREFVEQAFSYVGLNWEEYVRVDQKYFRPTETDDLLADSSKIRKIVRLETQDLFQRLGQDYG